MGTRYRIVALLGRGGMGEVYRADDLELGQSVALKFLPEKVAANPEWLRRFRNEVKTARQVAHPNMCRIYDIAEVDGHVFLSMEYIDGEDLAGVLRRMGRPSPEKAIEIARQICLGLAAAHEAHVLHRDLKPANIMIDGRGRVRITDFGLAGFLEELERQDARGGTPAYMAPEQLAHGKVSVRSDIYTLGLVLHELFTGKRVFVTNDAEELRRHHSSSAMSTPPSFREEVDSAVERVIARCLEPAPENRPQSVYQVLAGLPGGDPLAAALAAGDTPSPELVANARVEGGLRPAVALSVFGACIALVVYVAAGTDAHVPKPAKGPGVLAVEAQQVMERLGHTTLPADSAGRFAARPDGQGYRYWRRWSRAPLVGSNFHEPYTITPYDPPMSSPGDAIVVLTSTGVLRRLEVIPDATAQALGDVGWHTLLELAGVAPEGVEIVESVRMPRRPVEVVRAWRVKQSPEWVLQAGSVGGRITYCEFVPAAEPHADDPGAAPAGRVNRVVDYARAAVDALNSIAYIAMIVLAVRNVRARRSDLRAALWLAVIMMGLELFIELLSVRVHQGTLLRHLGSFQGGRAGAHVVLHGARVFVTYLAIEPYLRRLWARVLVGSMRLLSGRVTDPLVGREILFGSAAGIALACLTWAAIEFGIEQPSPGLNDHQLQALSGLSIPLIRNAMVIAWGVSFTGTFATLLVFGTIVLRRKSAAICVVGIFVAGQYFGILDFLTQEGTNGLMLAIGVAGLIGAVYCVLALRVGLISIVLSFAMFLSLGGLVFSLKLGEWYSVNTVISATFVLAFPAVGCWLSMAGQPIFRDVLAEPDGG